MSFPQLATKLVTKTFGQFQKTLKMITVNGSCEIGTAIDIKNNYNVNKTEDFDFVLITDTAQWIKSPTVGNIDLVFDGVNVKIMKVEKDSANAAYIISCNEYVRQQIIIEKLTTTSDGQGGFTDTWATFKTVQAEVSYANGSEALKSESLSTNQSIKFLFRFESGINEEMRVNFDGQLLPIKSYVNVDFRDQWIELITDRVAAS